MSGVLRVNASDPRVPNNGWASATSDHALICDSNRCKFLFLFRGTGITVYGKTDSLTNGALYLELDGTPDQIRLNGTTFGDGVAPIYHVENLGDDDHQLVGNVPVLVNGTILMDHFEIENSSGGGFDLLNAGPTARNVPAQAMIVDNTDPAIIYNTDSTWSKDSDDISSYARSVSTTFIRGASLSFSFDGVALWYYGQICTSCGPFNISIDGSIPQRLSGHASTDYHLVQRMIWSNTSLDPGRHTFTLTHDSEDDESGISFDFFRVLPGAGTSTANFGELPTTVSTVPPINQTQSNTVPPTDQNQSNTVPLAIGLTLGLLVLVAVVLFGVRHIRRRRRLDLDALDALDASPIHPASDKARRSAIEYIARRSSTCSTAATPMAAIDQAMWLGQPPSYEAPTHNWSVGKVR